MPRRKLARRFEPRYGISQITLDEETKWVKRELEDRLLMSTTDLHKGLSAMQLKVAKSEATLQAIFDQLPDRERLALKSMLARDVFHIALLYETAFRLSQSLQQASGPSTPAAEEVDRNDDPRPALVFSQSLFG